MLLVCILRTYYEMHRKGVKGVKGVSRGRMSRVCQGDGVTDNFMKLKSGEERK